MEGSISETSARSWLRCYRCWSQDLEVQVHYEGIHKIDPDTGERAEVIDELQEAVVQCLDCMHDQPHLGFNNGRVEPIEDRWERMIAGTPWVASCTVTVDADEVESCSGPEAGDALSYAAFGDHGVREFFTHVRFHKHEDDARIIVHLLVELYARSAEEATDVLEEAARGTLAITTLRSVTSTRWPWVTTNNALSAASLPFLGAVLSTTPPSGGRPPTAEHGTVAVNSTGVSEISGAVTLFSWPFCGQLSIAVVCTTGSSGVATDRTKPISPAIVATQRVTRTSRRASGCAVAACRSWLMTLMAGP